MRLDFCRGLLNDGAEYSCAGRVEVCYSINPSRRFPQSVMR
jgi:hypothetical protein